MEKREEEVGLVLDIRSQTSDVRIFREKRVACTLLFFLFSCQTSTKKLTNPSNCRLDSTKAINQESTFIGKYPLITWLRKNPAEFGCMLETEFGYRDSIFNCDYKNYENDGDPCKNTKEYYEGIEFPDGLVGKIHPLIKNIRLEFERGSLRELTVTFKDSILKSEIKKYFNLPLDKSKFPQNIQDIKYGENVYSNDKPVNENYTRWLNIIGFEHMGRGDVDCD